MNVPFRIVIGAILSLGMASAGCWPASTTAIYDVVLRNGTVMDPESGLDSIRNVGIANGTIVAVSRKPLQGRVVVDATNLVVAPGFIDLHSHGQNSENYRLQAADGVTTALEMEMGPADMDSWYVEREGQRLINSGATVGYQTIRTAVVKDAPGTASESPRSTYGEATPAERRQMLEILERGLTRGALGVGWHLNSTPGASQSELMDVFRVARKHGAMLAVDLRYLGSARPTTFLLSLLEVLGAAASTGASLHVCHVCSSAIRETGTALAIMADARAHGIDVSTECHPYQAAGGNIRDTYFDGDFRALFGIDYHDLQWMATGERLTAATFAKYRRTGGGVMIHYLPEEVVRAGLSAPFSVVISDGNLTNGRGHPRGTGTYSRFLGRYVRDQKLMPLMTGIRKISLMPAQELESRVPMMKKKGRIQVGADADITVFDPAAIIDRATYEEPARLSTGIVHVLVNGVFVVRQGALIGNVLPGRPVRAPALGSH